jgi:hypothetical protein
MGTRTQQEMQRVLTPSSARSTARTPAPAAAAGSDAPRPARRPPRDRRRPADRGAPAATGSDRVLRDGPADDGETGLLVGDIITHINGEPLDRDGTGRDLRWPR